MNETSVKDERRQGTKEERAVDGLPTDTEVKKVKLHKGLRWCDRLKEK